MRCPYCGHPNNRVIATSPPWNKNHTSYKQYRRCDNCRQTFITLERHVPEPKKRPHKNNYDKSSL